MSLKVECRWHRQQRKTHSKSLKGSRMNHKTKKKVYWNRRRIRLMSRNKRLRLKRARTNALKEGSLLLNLILSPYKRRLLKEAMSLILTVVLCPLEGPLNSYQIPQAHPKNIRLEDKTQRYHSKITRNPTTRTTIMPSRKKMLMKKRISTRPTDDIHFISMLSLLEE